MFNWVCPRCGHDVPPSKTECPFCAPPAPEATQPPAQQYPPPQQPPPQYVPPGAPQQYGQQPPPYWQPQGAPPQQYPPAAGPQYGQQPPPQYWQPQQPPYQPPQYQPQQPYQQQPPYQQPLEPQFQAPPVMQETPPQYAPPAPPHQQYTPPPPPPPVAEYRQPERTTTPWPPPEEQASKPTWLVALLAFAGVLVVFGIAYFLMGSHGSSVAKDAAKEQTTNPLQKYVEVVGIRLVSEKGVQSVKFLVVNHQGVEMTDLQATVTLWASTQRSEEDSVGTFTFHADSIGPNESKEMTAPLKGDKPSYALPDDWRNITADVQITSPGQ